MIDTEKNILIVEDEPSSAGSLAIGLKRAGFITRTAHSGDEGLKELQNTKFDFVLCDINMPKMDGWEFASKVKTVTEANFIFFTADSRVNKKTEFSSYPLLIKPIELSSIIELLNGKKEI